MTTTSCAIQGGDYEHAGTASRGLKEHLKRIGADPGAVRRAMIAAYEAEMNVVIHATRGRLEATVDGRRLDVVVADEGPGIPDIALAMRPGYSTAPAAARELGFGAGMGLPNIMRNSDVFAIESTPGRGTTVRFTIVLRPHEVRAPGRHSVRLVTERCTRCMRCLAVCPTRAMRVRGGPQILEHLCIDCTACMAVCPAGAITVEAVAEVLRPSADAVLIVPSAILSQFGRMAGPARVAEVLRGLGFGDVWVTGGWRRALAAAVAQQAAESPLLRPILSPACPAAMNLVAARFPSLLAHVAPFYSPLEVIHEELAGRRAVFVALCPAERSVLASAAGPGTVEVILPETLRAAVLPRLAEGRPDNLAAAAAVSPAGQAQRLTPDVVGADAPAGRAPAGPPPVASLMHVTGVRHVMHVLEEMENGQLGDVTAIELSMCDAGCWGAPTLAEDPYVAEHRLPAVAASDTRGRAARRRTPLVARAGLRLDADMARAMEKLARVHRIVHTLPGMDCGMCGSPTCAALAEDIVMGRAGGGPATADGASAAVAEGRIERVICVRLAEQEKGTP